MYAAYDTPLDLMAAYANLRYGGINEDYNNGNKHVAVFSGGWKYGVKISGSLWVDLDDYLGASEEGREGWVTVWIMGTKALGVSLLPVTLSVTSVQMDAEYRDPKSWAELVAYKITTPIYSIKTISMTEDGWNAPTGDWFKDLNVGISAASARICIARYEIRKTALQQVFAMWFPPLGVYYAGKVASESINRMAEYNGGSIIDLLLEANQYRWFSSGDDGTRLNYDGDFVYIYGGIDADTDGNKDNIFPVVSDGDWENERGKFTVKFGNTGDQITDYILKLKSETVPDGWHIQASVAPRVDGITKVEIDDVNPGYEPAIGWYATCMENAPLVAKVQFELYKNILGPVNDKLSTIEGVFAKDDGVPPPSIYAVTIADMPIADGNTIDLPKGQIHQIAAYCEGGHDLTQMKILIDGHPLCGDGPYTPGEVKNINCPWPTQALNKGLHEVDIKVFDIIEDTTIHEKTYSFQVHLHNTPPKIYKHHYLPTPDTNIEIYFEDDIDKDSISNDNITVSGSLSGDHLCDFNFDESTYKLTIVPVDEFIAQETVTVTISSGIVDRWGNALTTPYIIMFTVGSSISKSQNVHMLQLVELSADGIFLDMNPILWEWDIAFDGATFDTDATGKNTTHVFRDYGEMKVALRVTFDNNDSIVIEEVINVKPFPINISFPNGINSLRRQFSAPESPIVDKYSWNFGDNSFSETGRSQDHTYSQFSRYYVTLTLTLDDHSTKIISYSAGIPWDGSNADITVDTDYKLTEDELWAGNVIFSDAILDLNGYKLIIDGDMLVSGTSLLKMTSSESNLEILGNLILSGANSTSYLTAGILEVHGDFIQTGLNNSFDPSGTHTVKLSGINPQTICFEDPNVTFSHFNNLHISNKSIPGINFATTCYVSGNEFLFESNYFINSGNIMIGPDVLFDGTKWPGDLNFYNGRIMESNLDIDGNLNILNGNLNLNNKRLIVRGNLLISQPTNLNSLNGTLIARLDHQ